MTGKIAAKVVREIVKSLMISGVILAICIVVMQFNMTIGIILMMLYSSSMVIKSSRKEMPLNKFTALLPGGMSIITFLIMLGLIELNEPVMPMIGVGIGIVVGFLMARGHKVYEKNGVVYAKRTFFYILIWALSMLFTQGSTLAGIREIIGFSFLLNGLSTAMMVVLSLFLFMKASGGGGLPEKTRQGMISIIFCIVTVSTVSILFNTIEAISENKIAPTYSTSGKYIGPGFLSRETPIPPGIYSGGPDPYRWKYLTHRSSAGSAGIARVRVNNDGSMELLDEVNCQTKELGAMVHADGNQYDETTNLRIKQSSPAECSWCDGKVIVNRQIDTKIGRDNYQRTANWGIHQRPDGVLLLTFKTCCSGRMCDEQWLLYRGGLSTPSPTPDPNPTPQPSPVPTPQPNPYPHSDFEFSNDEATAGTLLALLMLLTGVGMNAAANAVMSGAISAAQEAANAAMMAGQDAAGSSEDGDENNWGYDSRTHSNGTVMLDGDEAIAWMKDKKNGYLDGNGNKTDKFEKFMASMPSQSGPGLQGIAEDVDKDGNPIYVIIVPDEEPRETYQANNSSDADEQPETTSDDDQDQSTDSSSSDSDDETTNKTEPSGTTPTDDNKTNTTDDSGDDDDQQDKSDTSTQDSKDKKAGISTNKPEPPTEQTPPIEYPNAKENLENIMDEITKDKIKEGYFVRNPHRLENLKENGSLPEKIIAYTPVGHSLGAILKWGEKGLNAIGEKLFDEPWHPWDDAWGNKGGQCGDYAQKGIDWSREKIRERYGENVKFDKIIIKSNLSPNYINHAATRVTLPNGDKYVLDYWEGIQNNEKRVYAEAEWTKRHSEKLNSLWQGTETDYEISTVDSSTIKSNDMAAASTHKRLLDKFIEKKGETQGKKLFLDHVRNEDKNALSQATKLVSQWRPKP